MNTNTNTTESIWVVTWTECGVTIALDYTDRDAAARMVSLLKWRGKDPGFTERKLAIELPKLQLKLKSNGYNPATRNYPRGRWS